MPEQPIPSPRQEPPVPVRRAEGDEGGGDRWAYAELDVTTNFSFLRGGSHPDELVYRSAELGYRAVAVTDVNTMAGVVRAWEAAKRARIRLVIGARLRFRDGTPDVLVWCADRRGYAGLCKLLTRGKRRAPKGECWLEVGDVLEMGAKVGEGWWVGVDGAWERRSDEATEGRRQRGAEEWGDGGGGRGEGIRVVRGGLGVLREVFGGRLSVLMWPRYGYDDRARWGELARVSRRYGVPLLACNHVHYHDPGRRALLDVLTCVREKCTIHEAGYRLFPNAERYPKDPVRMHRTFAAFPRALMRTLEVAEACRFTLDELRYEYPDEISPPGMSRTAYLRQLTEAGARERYPGGAGGVPEKVRQQIEHELALIERLRIEPYFLTVYDIVKFARSRGILCQGRGSAANSAVCYCLGITAVDPARIDLLFERFVSAARDEPPDIDVDFEHERREEVIQYVYAKYGRERCAMTAEVHTYRGRSAVRDVGKALGLGLDVVDVLAKRLDGWHGGVLSAEQIREAGLDPTDATVRNLVVLTEQLLGFPRHLSQHVGGLVMTRTPLEEMCPIENASMPGRTVLEWDKDDIDAVGMLKVDCLGLGMLTALGKGLRMVNGGNAPPWAAQAMRGRGPLRQCAALGRLGNEGKKWLHEADQEPPGSGGVESLEEAGSGGVSGDAEDASGGDVRVDLADAAGSSVGAVEHRRGICETDAAGLHQASSDCPWVACGDVYSVRTGGGASTDPRRQVHRTTDHRDTGCAACPYQEPRTQALAHPPSLPKPPRAAHCLSGPKPRTASLPPPLQLHTIPPEDPAVYDMICRADTVGVFQIESRAQMSMLPRLRPRCFYDLVIEVAIVRPGPIQGNMVHPYLRRRNGEEPVTFPSKELESVLGKTLGVPLFQEQAMKVAMVAAGFSAEEADRLRRSMAAWRYNGAIETFRPRIVEGMLANGYSREYAEQTFEQIRGFGEYGFPESHAASFALLVYASCWLKRYHPAAFCAALLNSQPMGFYAPAQLVRDAREHGVEVRGVDVNASEWETTLEARHAPDHLPPAASQEPASWGRGGPAVRLGFHQVRGMREGFARAIVAEREARGAFVSVDEFHRRTGLPRHAILLLAEADAFASLGLPRRHATWDALTAHSLTAMEGVEESDRVTKRQSDKVRSTDAGEVEAFHSVTISPPSSLPFLPQMPLGQEVMLDYATTGLSLRAHPVGLVREALVAERVLPARVATSRRNGSRVKVCGLVLVRQRPGTASGIVFMTLEDETGVVNLIIRPPVWEKYRPAARHAGLLLAHGVVETHSNVTHVLVTKLEDRSSLLAGYRLTSRDFH